MTRSLPFVAMLGLVLCALGCAPGLAGGAGAQPVPVKTIDFYNNSDKQTLFPVIQAPIMNGAGVHDLWMQAQFKSKNLASQIFNTTLLYRVFVNREAGIPPHGHVRIAIPFYTQLLPTTAVNAGTVDDQFIDWWNAMRVFVFDGRAAVRAAYDYSVDRHGNVIPPIAIQPIAGAAVPSCIEAVGAECAPLSIKAYVNGFPTSVPAQLVEYTFAAAQGPPLNPILSIDTTIVNFNISGVDQVYLPATIAAHGNKTAANTYLGSIQSIATFRDGMNDFAAQGGLWPVYVPAYYAAAHPTVPLPQPPAGTSAYPLPQVASTNTVYAESFRDPPPAPPVLSSDTLKGIGVLGTTAQATSDLWTKCTATAADLSPTCTEIRAIDRFFTDDYRTCFPGKKLPSQDSLLRDVYGWVQFPGCATPLAQAKGYVAAIETYCTLQYNFFDPAVPAARIFNPYVSLVHRTLKSNAYAFSIDDAVSFKSLPGDGIIVTVAGPRGLENHTQTPLPTAKTYRTYCRQS